jgi:hypothetical protein
MSEQREQITRVNQAIAMHVTEYLTQRIGCEPWHVEDLRRHVIANVPGHIAPASPDRILRDLRQKNVVNYEVVSRSKSLYRSLPPGERKSMDEERDYCRSCPAEIMWFNHHETLKANPLDIAGTPDGNLVINRDTKLYRAATKEEKETAKATGKLLYVSHFATCPNSAAHRKEAQEKAVMLSKRAARDKATAEVFGPLEKK